MIPVTAVVPTMNEERTIADLVEVLWGLGCEVIVSDASTKDHTAYEATAAGAVVVHPKDGLGAAYMAAWDVIPWTHSIVHVDAGGSHSPDDIAAVVDATRSSGCDVVIGSRFADGGSHEGGWKHRSLSRTAASVSNVLSNKPVRDWTSGLRGYSQAARKAITGHRFVCEGHAWQIEALDVCLRKGLTVREVPIIYRPSSSQRGIGRTLEAFRAWEGMLLAGR